MLLDTSTISGFVNEDTKPQDYEAFCKIVEMAKNRQVTIWVSTVTKEELDNVPSTYRSSHLKEYEAFEKIRASETMWIDTTSGSTELTERPEYKEIQNILKDENDARLAFQGKMSGVNTFVTIDYKTILNKANLLKLKGVIAMSPSEYFFQLLTHHDKQPNKQFVFARDLARTTQKARRLTIDR